MISNESKEILTNNGHNSKSLDSSSLFVSTSLMVAESSCADFTITTKKDEYGSVVSETICVELITSATSSLVPLSQSTITPITTVDATEKALLPSTSVPVATNFTCDHTSILLTKDINGVLVSKTVCDGSAPTISSYASPFESSNSVESFSSFTEISSLMETASSCDHFTTFSSLDMFGSMVIKTDCVESIATSTAEHLSTEILSQDTGSSSTITSFETSLSCDETTVILTTDTNGSIISKTICVDSDTKSYTSSSSRSDDESSLTKNSAYYTSFVSGFSSIEASHSCSHYSTVLSKNMDGSLISKEVCVDATSTSQSSLLYSSDSPTGYTGALSISTSTEITSSCDQYTTVLNKDSNGALVSQPICVETTDSILSDSSLLDSSSVTTTLGQISSLSSTVKSVKSFSSCDHFGTILSKDAQGILVSQTICIDDSDIVETTSSSSILSATALGTPPDYASITVLTTSSSFYSSPVTATSDCDDFSTVLLKDSNGLLLSQTICMESNLAQTTSHESSEISSSTYPSTSSLNNLPSSVSLESTPRCDQYATVTGTDMHGLLIFQTKCINTSDASSHGDSVATSSTISSLRQSPSAPTAMVFPEETYSTCDHFTTILTIGSNGEFFRTVCMDSMESFTSTTSSASLYSQTLLESIDISDSPLSTSTVISSITVSTVASPDDTTLPSAIHSSSEGFCLTIPLPTLSSSSKFANNVNTISTENDQSNICNTVNMIDTTIGTTLHSPYITQDTLDVVSSSDTTSMLSSSAIPSLTANDDDLVCQPMTSESLPLTSTVGPFDASFVTDGSGTTIASSNAQILSYCAPKEETQSSDKISETNPTPTEIPVTSSSSTKPSTSSMACAPQKANSTTGPTAEMSQCSGDDNTNTKVISDTNAIDINETKVKSICGDGDNSGSSGSSNSSSSYDTDTCGNPSGSSISSSGSNSLNKNGGGFSSSSSSGSGIGGSSSSSSSSSSGSGNSSSSSSSSGNGNSSSSSSSSGSGNSSSSSSSSGSGSSSSSSSSNGNGNSSSSSSSSGSASGGQLSSSSTSSSSSFFGASFLDNCSNSSVCNPPNNLESAENNGFHRSSSSRHSSTTSSSSSSISKDGTSINSSSQSGSESNTIEDSISVAGINGTSTTTHKQTENSSFSDSISETTLPLQEDQKMIVEPQHNFDDENKRKESIAKPVQKLKAEQNINLDIEKDSKNIIQDNVAMGDKVGMFSENVAKNTFINAKSPSEKDPSSFYQEGPNNNNSNNDLKKLVKRRRLVRKPKLRKKIRHLRLIGFNCKGQ
ncbi:hypothetical protein BD408DRAFT_442265 [Parasitella parasitica]|nr:hypothetical protein BD408DRAFT_442265 [Parasitella parasitica]